MCPESFTRPPVPWLSGFLPSSLLFDCFNACLLACLPAYLPTASLSFRRVSQVRVSALLPVCLRASPSPLPAGLSFLTNSGHHSSSGSPPNPPPTLTHRPSPQNPLSRHHSSTHKHRHTNSNKHRHKQKQTHKETHETDMQLNKDKLHHTSAIIFIHLFPCVHLSTLPSTPFSLLPFLFHLSFRLHPGRDVISPRLIPRTPENAFFSLSKPTSFYPTPT